MKRLIPGLIILIFIGLSLVVLLNFPPIWPDEALYADVVRNYFAQGQLKVSILGNMLLGAKEHAYWNPPMFFYLLIFWFKLFPQDIFHLRLLSLSVSVCYLVITGLIIKQLWPKISFLVFTIFLLFITTNQIFFGAAHVSRPEIFVLLFGSLALLCYIWSEKYRPNNILKRRLLLIVSGFWCSITFLIHMLGLMFLLAILSHWFYKKRQKIFHDVGFYLFLLVFALPLIIWLITLIPHWQIFAAQMFLAVQNKTLGSPSFVNIIRFSSWRLKLEFVNYIAMTVLVFWYVIRKSNKIKMQILVIFLALAWLIQFSGKMLWYFVYIIPFAYLGLIITFKTSPYNMVRKIVLFSLFLALFLNLDQLREILFNNYTHRNDYYIFTTALAKEIPRGKKILIAVIPTPYFGLINSNDYEIYQIPALNTNKNTYLETLNRIDYVVYSEDYNYLGLRDLFKKYIALNTQRTIPINIADFIKAYIFELKPVTLRVSTE